MVAVHGGREQKTEKGIQLPSFLLVPRESPCSVTSKILSTRALRIFAVLTIFGFPL